MGRVKLYLKILINDYSMIYYVFNSFLTLNKPRLQACHAVTCSLPFSYLPSPSITLKRDTMKASQILDIQREALRNAARRYADKGISNLRVFGSVATGNDTEDSDIDFLIDAEHHVSLFTIGGLYSDLEDIVQRSIDLVVTDEIPPSFKNRILAEAKPV